MGLEITGGVPCSGFYLVWVLLSGLPFLLRPLAWAERRFRPKMTLISQHGKRAWVHLALAAHHRPDAVACLSVLAERERLNLSGTGNTPHRYHLIAPADRYTCPQATGPHHGIWTHGPQPYLSDSFYSWKRALMQLEILFRQWRWRTDFRRDWPVLVLRRKSLNTEK
jgi:hypothetical protein